MPARRSASRLIPAVLFLVGFAVTANLVILDRNANVFRLTDLLTIALLPVALFRLATGRWYRSTFLIGIPATLLLALLLLTGVWKGELAQVAYVGRAGLAFVVVGALFRHAATAERQAHLFAGMASGAIVVALIGLAQATDLTPLAHALRPEEAPQTWNLTRERFSGIWGHPNEMAQIQILGVVAAIVLARTGRQPLLWWAACLFVVGATYWVTQTRATLVVAAAAIGLAILSQSKQARLGGVALGLVAAAILAAALPPEVTERFFGVSEAGATLSTNIVERLATWRDGLALLIRYPLGLGVEGRMPVMNVAYGITATHNSFLALALGLGAATGTAFTIATLWMLARSFSGARADPAALLFTTALILLFLIEDSVYSISVLMVWFLAFGLAMQKGRARRAALADPVSPGAVSGRAQPV